MQEASYAQHDCRSRVSQKKIVRGDAAFIDRVGRITKQAIRPNFEGRSNIIQSHHVQTRFAEGSQVARRGRDACRLRSQSAVHRNSLRTVFEGVDSR